MSRIATMQQMYIFVDSERPDVYVNALVHGIMHCDVRSVCFLHIKGLAGSTVDHTATGYSARIMTSVQSLFESLAERAEYKTEKGEIIQIANKSKSFNADRIRDYYYKCRRQLVNYSNKDVEYSELKNIIQMIAKDKTGICDVSGIRKTYLGDLVAAGLGEGLSGLYIFELLLQHPNYAEPWTILIHALEAPTPLYRYTNILDTPVYKGYNRLMLVISTRLKLVTAVILSLLLVAMIFTFVLGPDSELSKALNVISQLASIISLLLVVIVPPLRRN